MVLIISLGQDCLMVNEIDEMRVEYSYPMSMLNKWESSSSESDGCLKKCTTTLSFSEHLAFRWCHHAWHEIDTPQDLHCLARNSPAMLVS